jgi:hypothetical protein
LDTGFGHYPAASDVPSRNSSGTSITRTWNCWQGRHNFVAQKSFCSGESLPQCCKSCQGLERDCPLNVIQTWFTSALDDLKSSPEGALSPTTPRQLEPISAATPYTPYLPLMPQILPNEQLKLPLSQAMALLVISNHGSRGDLPPYSVSADSKHCSRHTNSSPNLSYIPFVSIFGVGLYITWMLL